MTDVRDKFAGVVLGTAIGDALGYPVEFLSREQIIAKHGPGGVTGFQLQGIPPIALYSDDTQMFRAVCEGLIRAGPDASLDKAAEEIAEEFIAWAFGPENNRSPGMSCMSGCHNLKAGSPWRMAGQPNGKGCGAAMRAMAYGLWFWDDPATAAEWAATHALMTHRDASAQASAAAMAAGVAAGIESSDLEIVADVMIGAAHPYDVGTSQMIAQAVDEATRLFAVPEVVLDRWRGWKGDEAVAASLYCALLRRRYPSAVLLAVNSSGDSDSLGCMTGALVGAVEGAAGSIPTEWISQVEKSQELMALTMRLWKAWHQRSGIMQVPLRRGREKPISEDHTAEVLPFKRA